MLKTERDALIQVIDDVAGPVPSAISEQLRIMGEAIATLPAGSARNKLEVAQRAIIAANLKLGTSPGEEATKPGVILLLRQKVLALSVDPEAPPVVTPPAPPSGAILVTPSGTTLPALDPDGRNRTFLAMPGTLYDVAITGLADMLSMSCDNGPLVFGTSHTAPGGYPNSASESGKFVAGDKMFVGIPASRPAANIIYSALKYAG